MSMVATNDLYRGAGGKTGVAIELGQDEALEKSCILSASKCP
jgi:hypothetical protein